MEPPGLVQACTKIVCRGKDTYVIATCIGNYVYNTVNNLCSAVAFSDDVEKVLVKSNRPTVVKHLRVLGSFLG
jgi:hypothetical protein